MPHIKYSVVSVCPVCWHYLFSWCFSHELVFLEELAKEDKALGPDKHPRVLKGMASNNYVVGRPDKHYVNILYIMSCISALPT